MKKLNMATESEYSETDDGSDDSEVESKDESLKSLVKQPSVNIREQKKKKPEEKSFRLHPTDIVH